MKKLLIILVFLASVATLHSTEYKFFTAKQGLPKAIEAAKQLSNDSLGLLAICCSLQYANFYYSNDTNDSITVNDTNGTAQQWYYEFAFPKKDSVYWFRIQNDGISFLVDSLISYIDSLSRFSLPININEFKIDSDSLNKYAIKCKKYFQFVPLAMMFLCNNDGSWPFLDNYPLWASDYFTYNGDDPDGYDLFIDAYTGECLEVRTKVKDYNNYIEQFFVIKIIPNSDIISIHSNLEIAQYVVLRVFDQLGSLVKETSFKSQDYQFSTASLTQGLYFVQLIYGNKIETKPVMVLH
ncbi:MAG: T9SS type A sorting domain-containing protein [FCB group bacterium]|jgi:predicted small secreted protein